MKKLNAEFFACDCVELARRLLGKVLCVKAGNEIIKKVITETEAYGVGDTACHGYKGRTKRNAPMFAQGGTVYVYLCYGLHEILNFAAGADGEGQGVMIRGIESAVGPGRVTKALNIDRSFNDEFLPTSKRIWLESGVEFQQQHIEELKRVGIGYASQEDQDKLWRFRLKR
jgi:DNA-3-methyladenine glycosylase